MTINAMVAGVQAGRISADVFIFSDSFGWRQPSGCVESKWDRENGDSRQLQPKPDKGLK